ncbi:hypothetical protein BDW60DRAFT_222136 [Aspergillus nidulans var. acristatus]
MSTTEQVDLTEDRGAQMRELLIVMLILPVVAVILRFWSRALLPDAPGTRMVNRFWWDDWAALVATMINIAVCGIGIRLVEVGLGRHVAAVSPRDLTIFLKLLWTEYYVFDTGTAVAKASALLFYARIFTRASSRFRYCLWAVHACNVCWLIGILLAVVFECLPIAKVWNPSLSGSCQDTRILWMGSGITSLIIDVFILVLPVPMVWRLKATPMRKILATLVLISGYLVVVVSIGRLVLIVESGDGLDVDPTYESVDSILWLASEIPISVVSVCLPSIFFLIRRGVNEGWWAVLTLNRASLSARLLCSRGQRSGMRLTGSNNSMELGPTIHDYDLDMGPKGESGTSESHVTALQPVPGEVLPIQKTRIMVERDFTVV